MTSPEWEAANEDDSDRFPQPSPHVAPAAPVDPLRSDSARVARYAEALRNADNVTLEETNFGQLSATYDDAARAVVAVADEERAALVAEVERLRGVASDHERWRSLWEERCIRAVDRAETAEAKLAKVEALADEWECDMYASPQSCITAGPQVLAADGCLPCRLRAALADAPAEAVEPFPWPVPVQCAHITRQGERCVLDSIHYGFGCWGSEPVPLGAPQHWKNAEQRDDDLCPGCRSGDCLGFGCQSMTGRKPAEGDGRG